MMGEMTEGRFFMGMFGLSMQIMGSTIYLFSFMTALLGFQ
jgi:hypothetical protein